MSLQGDYRAFKPRYTSRAYHITLFLGSVWFGFVDSYLFFFVCFKAFYSPNVTSLPNFVHKYGFVCTACPEFCTRALFTRALFTKLFHMFRMHCPFVYGIARSFSILTFAVWKFIDAPLGSVNCFLGSLTVCFCTSVTFYFIFYIMCNIFVLAQI